MNALRCSILETALSTNFFCSENFFMNSRRYYGRFDEIIATFYFCGHTISEMAGRKKNSLTEFDAISETEIL